MAITTRSNGEVITASMWNELVNQINTNDTDIDTNATDLTNHLNDTVDAHDATAISYDNSTSGMSAIQVNAAIDEAEARLQTAEGNITTNATNLTNHLNDTIGAHAASAISYDNSGSGLSATEVNTAIDQLDGDIDAHINQATGAHAATAISYNNATSGLSATQVNAAIDEVEGRLDTAETNISTNASDIADIPTTLNPVSAYLTAFTEATTTGVFETLGGWTETRDPSSSFNATTGVYTAERAGDVKVELNLCIIGRTINIPDSNLRFDLVKNGSTTVHFVNFVPGDHMQVDGFEYSYPTLKITVPNLAANDTLEWSFRDSWTTHKWWIAGGDIRTSVHFEYDYEV